MVTGKRLRIGVGSSTRGGWSEGKRKKRAVRESEDGGRNRGGGGGLRVNGGKLGAERARGRAVRFGRPGARLFPSGLGGGGVARARRAPSAELIMMPR
jgi:hypothetical protein